MLVSVGLSVALFTVLYHVLSNPPWSLSLLFTCLLALCLIAVVHVAQMLVGRLTNKYDAIGHDAP